MMRKIILILILTLSLPVFAKEKNLGDYHVFNDALKAKGIDYFSTNWIEVNSACDFYKDDGEPEYNQCRLEKAEQNKNFTSDRTTCDQKAFNSYPDALMRGTEEHIIKETSTAENREIRILKGKMSADEITQRRSAYFISCMSNFGWRDPNNWAAGSR